MMAPEEAAANIAVDGGERRAETEGKVVDQNWRRRLDVDDWEVRCRVVLSPPADDGES